MKLFYREKGEGTPLLILHGLWGASENWLPVANRLADRFRVILPDLRGHGRSPREPVMDIETMRDDIRGLIESLSLHRPPDIAGHSLGGKIAMMLRIASPALISKTIIIDVAPVTYPPDLFHEHARLLHLAESLDLSRFPTLQALSAALHAVPHVVPHAVPRDVPRDVPHVVPHVVPRAVPRAVPHVVPRDEWERQVILKNVRKSPGGLTWKINLPAIRAHLDHFRGFPSPPIVPPIVPPGGDILFIKASRSPYIPGLHAIHPIFPAARLVQVDDCGHHLHQEQPGPLASAIRDFLE
ncbi:MAG: alpha/beta fold hydrolase [Odoribacteraceae bacterium]|nr:alpha/beta fold hydrolase [Odoribacteraceae bacterium]